MKNGVLTVRVPKRPETQPRRISSKGAAEGIVNKVKTALGGEKKEEKEKPKARSTPRFNARRSPSRAGAPRRGGAGAAPPPRAGRPRAGSGISAGWSEKAHRARSTFAASAMRRAAAELGLALEDLARHPGRCSGRRRPTRPGCPSPRLFPSARAIGSAKKNADAVRITVCSPAPRWRATVSQRRAGQVARQVLVVEGLHDGAKLREGAAGVALEADPLRVGARAQAELGQRVGPDQARAQPRAEQAAADRRQRADHAESRVISVPSKSRKTIISQVIRGRRPCPSRGSPCRRRPSCR